MVAEGWELNPETVAIAVDQKIIAPPKLCEDVPYAS